MVQLKEPLLSIINAIEYDAIGFITRNIFYI